MSGPKLSHDAQLLFLSCANEVLRGYKVNEFRSSIGASEAEVATIESRAKESLGTASFSPTPAELRIVLATIDEVERTLGDREVATRVGFSLEKSASIRFQTESTLGRIP